MLGEVGLIYGTGHCAGLDLLSLAAFSGLVITPACKLGYIADDLDMIAINQWGRMVFWQAR